MVDSFKKNKYGIILMCISSLCVCVGQLFWKLSVNNGVFTLLFGFLFYGIGAIIMILAYRHGSLSVLQPILSLNYVFSIILARVVLYEEITIIKLVGVLIIVAGVVLIVGGDE